MAKIWNTDNIKCSRMWSKRNTHSLLVGMQNGTAALEDSLVIPYKTQLIITM